MVYVLVSVIGGEEFITSMFRATALIVSSELDG